MQERIRNQAALDSRRVSSGVLCEIIYSKKIAQKAQKDDTGYLRVNVDKGLLLSLLYKYGYFPENVNAKQFPFGTGVSTDSGVLFAIPLADVEFVEQELERLNMTYTDQDKALNAKRDAQARALRDTPDNRAIIKAFTELKNAASTQRTVAEQEFMRNIQEHIIIASVDPISETPGNRVANGIEYFAYIDTREQGMPRAQLVVKQTPNFDPPLPSWTESVRNKKEATDQKAK